MKLSYIEKKEKIDRINRRKTENISRIKILIELYPFTFHHYLKVEPDRKKITNNLKYKRE